MTFKGPRVKILEEAIATNETVVVYTVPEGKVFKLVEAMLVTNAGAAGTAELMIHNSGHVRHIGFVDVRTNNQGIVLADHFNPSEPIPLPYGCAIQVVSDTALLAAEADIFGWEEDAEGF